MALFSSRRRPPSDVPPRRPSMFRKSLRGAGFVLGSPIATVGVSDIREGADFVGRCYRQVRDGGGSDERLCVRDDGSIDLAETAVRHGVEVDDVRDLLIERRAQTAQAARILFCFGAVSIPAWFMIALTMPLASSRIVSLIEFLPFCTVFFLFAFKSAWTNWQIRTLRMGSPREYLSTSEPFLPS